MSECYAIVNQQYDSTTIVGIYQRREDADKLVAEVVAYCAANPAPRHPAMSADDASFSRWLRADKKWAKGHPLGMDYAYYRDDFQVWPLPYFPTETGASQ